MKNNTFVPMIPIVLGILGMIAFGGVLAMEINGFPYDHKIFLFGGTIINTISILAFMILAARNE